jgi:hypothetical protein
MADMPDVAKSYISRILAAQCSRICSTNLDGMRDTG